MFFFFLRKNSAVGLTFSTQVVEVKFSKRGLLNKLGGFDIYPIEKRVQTLVLFCSLLEYSLTVDFD
jgi:hypothetical protein